LQNGSVPKTTVTVTQVHVFTNMVASRLFEVQKIMFAFDSFYSSNLILFNTTVMNKFRFT
jgi:TRAP-type C4-dicarboxylate transport system substrate-binding protein